MQTNEGLGLLIWDFLTPEVVQGKLAPLEVFNTVRMVA